MRVLILGAGGHGQVVANILLAMQQAGRPLTPIGYLDDNQAIWGAERLGLPVLGPLAALDEVAHDGVLIGIGDNQRRKALYAAMVVRGEELPAAIHPSCVVNFGAGVGPGSVLAPFSLVGTAVQLGANTALNGMVLLGHHTVVGDHALFGPMANIGGEVEIGEGALVGQGAIVMSRRSVSAWATVGAASLVTRSVEAGATVLGQPARVVAPAGTSAPA